jgi:methyl-accepting chemotaxis protein
MEKTPMDENGKPAGKNGAPKSSRRKAASKNPASPTAAEVQEAHPLAGALQTLQAIADGDLSRRAPVSQQADPAIQRLALLLNRALDRAEQAASQTSLPVITQAVDALNRVATDGDLTSWNLSSSDPVLGGLFDGVGKVLETQKTFVREINEAALRLSSSANEVLAASTQHETSSTEQAAAIHETTATMEELKHASAQIAENAGSVARVAEETLGSARSGRSAITEFSQAMQQIRSDGIAVVDSISKLSRRVERIGTVVEVIDEIADRSDLLALNAALEGSRAGEAGKGFSIVAAEMRRLAENVMESTKEIKNLISEIRESTHAAAAAAEASRRATEQGEKLGSIAAGSVEGILSGVQETSDAARVINLATQQQRTATEQVVASMSEIEEVTRQTTQASRQATSAAADLAQLANRLAELIKRFKAD